MCKCQLDHCHNKRPQQNTEWHTINSSFINFKAKQPTMRRPINSDNCHCTHYFTTVSHGNSGTNNWTFDSHPLWSVDGISLDGLFMLWNKTLFCFEDFMILQFNRTLFRSTLNLCYLTVNTIYWIHLFGCTETYRGIVVCGHHHHHHHSK